MTDNGGFNPVDDRTGPIDDNYSATAKDLAFAREIALRLLTIRSRSRYELEQALVKKGVPNDSIQTVIDRFVEVGLIDDRAFTQAWLSGIRAQNRSSALLRQELRQKGVSEEVLADVFAGLDRDREIEVARQLAVKKQATVADLPKAVQYRRIAGVLSRRGFSSDICRTVLAEVLATVV